MQEEGVCGADHRRLSKNTQSYNLMRVYHQIKRPTDKLQCVRYNQACNSLLDLVDATMYGWQKKACGPSQLLQLLMTIDSIECVPKECLDIVFFAYQKTKPVHCVSLACANAKIRRFIRCSLCGCRVHGTCTK